MGQMVVEGHKGLRHGGVGGAEAQVPQDGHGGSPHGHLGRGSVGSLAYLFILLDLFRCNKLFALI